MAINNCVIILPRKTEIVSYIQYYIAFILNRESSLLLDIH